MMTSGQRVLTALFLCALTCSVTAEDSVRSCTLLACMPDAAKFAIQRSDGRLPEFGLSLEVDGKTSSCLLPEISESDFPTTSCGDGNSVIVREIVKTTTTMTSASSWSFDHQRTGRFEALVVVLGSPEKVTISLMEGDRKSAEREFIPTYRVSYPNGPQCGDACSSFETTWIVP